MSGLDAGFTTSILHGEQNLQVLGGISPRFFQKQMAFDGGCAFRAFNNALGKQLLTKASIRQAFREEENFFSTMPEELPRARVSQAAFNSNVRTSGSTSRVLFEKSFGRLLQA